MAEKGQLAEFLFHLFHAIGQVPGKGELYSIRVPRIVFWLPLSKTHRYRINMDNDQPVIVQKRSLKLVMEPGTYFWCACGRSANQPFCDGTHKGTKFKPEKVVVEEKQLVKWCMCRHSNEGAICDNKHRELD